MHYFSMATVEEHSREAQRQVRELSRTGDAYRDHCLVWKLFADGMEQRKFLFRRRPQAGLAYYVVSPTPPQAVPGLLRVTTKPYHPTLGAGEWLRFELQANPTVARKFGPAQPGRQRRSRRHDVLMDAKHTAASAEQSQPEANAAVERASLQWLLDHAAHWGLEPQAESVLTSGYTQHRLCSRQRSIRFSSLDYTGVARVTAPDLLVRALTEGVGHARSFGCGLLLARRLA